MRKHILYRIISFILLPVAALFGLICLPLAFIGLANPTILLPLFIVAGVVIYIITSFMFQEKAIIGGRLCKPGLKDWIKVNAYVSIVFAVLVLMNSVAALSDPKLMSQAIDEALAMQQPANPQMTKEFMLRVANIMMYAFVAIAALLLVHIYTTFRLLKAYQHFFKISANDPQ